MNKKYIVELTSEERTQLIDIINAKRMAAHSREVGNTLYAEAWQLVRHGRN